jgi:hypothetical protein
LDRKEVAEPKVEKGLEYIIAPADKVRPVPRASRRALLAPELASGAVPEFNRNIANRLWALMMGQGLVQPVDWHNSDNPPSHPELLETLAREFVSMHFDVKAFLRELALSRAYQRSSEPPPGSSAEAAEPAQFAVAALKPLSPEQLAWSVMQATGMVASARAEAERRYDVVDPKMRAILQTDSKRLRLHDELIESAVYEKLKGNIQPFIKQFAPAPGQAQVSSEPTVHQALFLTNGQPIQGWLAPSGSNLTGRLTQVADPPMIAEELYLCLLSRRPTPDEHAAVADYLAKRGAEKSQAISELAWAIIASTEFRFNH